MDRLCRVDHVVVDDIGMLPVGPDAAKGLYRLVDAAYERRSVAVSSNLPPQRLRRAHAQDRRHRDRRPARALRRICVTTGDSYRLTEATAGKGVTPLA